jgi:FAD/FMN-containing dehydrogenase
VAFVSPIDTGRLASQIAGEVITPGHGEYEVARRVWNGMIDRRPAVIARCTSAADVAASLGFASDVGVRVAVRGGSHNVAGNATCDDGLVVDLSPMQSVEVDFEARRARWEEESPGVSSTRPPSGTGWPRREV